MGRSIHVLGQGTTKSKEGMIEPLLSIPSWYVLVFALVAGAAGYLLVHHFRVR